ncbi:MAG TPA: DUF6596 domain-containing protein, partial [Candidatus Binataceae bacterium]|nr:DUF6596 domain-containing protein [Candidatus Binataceae bacterium]
LGRILCELPPARSEPRGLLALMLLHDARRAARTGPDGEIILLEEQDRSRWNRAQIDEGLALVDSALRISPIGPYAIQAAIAGVHARAAESKDTDWREIEALYAYLMKLQPSPVVELNHAAAIAMAGDPARALEMIESICARGELGEYHLLWAARADLMRRMGRWAEAADSYRAALALAKAEPERRFLLRRMGEVERRQPAC